MNNSYKPLTRSTTNKMVAGVCAGLGNYFNIDPTVVRLLFVLGVFLAGPAMLLVYIIMAVVTPEETAVTQ